MIDERPLPTAIESEKAVLGSILEKPGEVYEAGAKLRPDDFSLDAHRRIFSHMLAMSDRQEPIDMVSVMRTMQVSDDFRTVGGSECAGLAYLGDLQSFAITSIRSIGYHCRAIKETANLRRLYQMGALLQERTLDPQAKSTDLAASVQEAILAMQTTSGEFRRLDAVMTDAVEKLQSIKASDDLLPGLTTTIADLDMGTTGIRPSEYWVIGARPNVGKTPVAMQIALAQALRGFPVAVFSLEMADFQLAWRCISHAGIAKPRTVRDPKNARDDQWASVESAPERVRGLPLWIHDTADLTIKQLRHKARYMVMKQGVRLIVVDYLQLIQASGKGEYERVTAASAGLRLLARETGCPVLALSQLNRQAKNLEEPPCLADLRSSGAIEQDVNVAAFIHRPPDPQGAHGELSLKGKIIMGKVREGLGGDINVTFDPDTLTFKGGWA